jgi:threonine/homoserine/homoserine lactone efflux protein
MVVAVAAFSLAAALIVLLPGPDTLVVVRELLRDGRARAAQTVAGVLSGLSVWVIAAALGLSALLRASQAGYIVLKIAGAAYLIWLGVQSLRMRRLTGAAERGAPTVGPGASGSMRKRLLGRGFVAGFATDLLNPKVGVFFVTFLPGFVPHGYSVVGLSLLFGAIFILETALYFTVLLAVAKPVTRWMADHRIRRRMDTATGVVLIGLGVRLAVDQ